MFIFYGFGMWAPFKLYPCMYELFFPVKHSHQSLILDYFSQMDDMDDPAV